MPEPSLEVLNDRLLSLHKDVSEVKKVLESVNVALTTLARIEERQSATNNAMNRAFLAIERAESRLSALERESPVNRRNGVWMERGIIAIVTGAAVFLWEQIKK